MSATSFITARFARNSINPNEITAYKFMGKVFFEDIPTVLKYWSGLLNKLWNILR
jgi:hypothetical protein